MGFGNGQLAGSAALGATQPLYTSTTTKGGDTVPSPLTEAAFASKYTFPANSLQVGQWYQGGGQGTYLIGTGATSPAAVAKIKLGAVPLITTQQLNVAAGTGVGFGFYFTFVFRVDSIGAAASIYASAQLTFALTGGAAPTAATVPIINTAAVNSTTALDLSLSVLYAPATAGTGTFFKLNNLFVSLIPAPAAAN